MHFVQRQRSDGSVIYTQIELSHTGNGWPAGVTVAGMNTDSGQIINRPTVLFYYRSDSPLGEINLYGFPPQCAFAAHRCIGSK